VPVADIGRYPLTDRVASLIGRARSLVAGDGR
jgi:hypothetical protein